MDRPVKVHRWDRRGKSLGDLDGHLGRIHAMAWNRAGDALATAGEDPTVRLWNRQGGLIARLAGHEAAVEDLAWSPNDRMLATASRDGTVRLWDEEGYPLATLTLQFWSSFPVAMRISGMTMMSGGVEPQEILVARRHDGMALASVIHDRIGRIWATDLTNLYREAVAKLVLRDPGVRDRRSQPAWDPLDRGRLLTDLRSGGAAVRQSAASALGHLGPASGETVTLLVARLKDQSPLVREAAAGALGRLRAGTPEDRSHPGRRVAG